MFLFILTGTSIAAAFASQTASVTTDGMTGSNNTVFAATTTSELIKATQSSAAHTTISSVYDDNTLFTSRETFDPVMTAMSTSGTVTNSTVAISADSTINYSTSTSVDGLRESTSTRKTSSVSTVNSIKEGSTTEDITRLIITTQTKDVRLSSAQATPAPPQSVSQAILSTTTSSTGNVKKIIFLS